MLVYFTRVHFSALAIDPKFSTEERTSAKTVAGTSSLEVVVSKMAYMTLAALKAAFPPTFVKEETVRVHKLVEVPHKTGKETRLLER